MTVPHENDGWRKASDSNQDANCVEIACDDDLARMRDTEARGQGHLQVSA